MRLQKFISKQRETTEMNHSRPQSRQLQALSGHMGPVATALDSDTGHVHCGRMFCRVALAGRRTVHQWTSWSRSCHVAQPKRADSPDSSHSRRTVTMAPRGGGRVKPKLCAHTLSAQARPAPFLGCCPVLSAPCATSLSLSQFPTCAWAKAGCSVASSGQPGFAGHTSLQSASLVKRCHGTPPAPQGTGAGYYLGRTVPGKTYISDALDNLRAGHVLLPLLSKAPRKGRYDAPHIPSPPYLQHKEEVDPKTSSLQLGYPVITDRD